MLKSIRQHLTARQLLVLVVVVLVTPFWVINYEEWLKKNKLDQVLVEADKAVSEPGFWDPIIGWLDTAAQIANSEYVIGGVISAIVLVFGPTIAHALASAFVKVQAKFGGREFSPNEPATVVQPAESAPKIWPKTSEYDLPIKLKVIDDLLDIVGSEKECELLCREGVEIARGYVSSLNKKDKQEYMDELVSFKDKCMKTQEKTSKIRKDNERYDDIHEMLSSTTDENPLGPIARFIQAIKNLGTPPTGNFEFFIGSYATDFRDGMNNFGGWRFRTEKALLERRKELSS